MKHTFLCLVFVLSLLVLQAQDQENKSSSWGIRLGTNISNQYDMAEGDSKQLFKPCLMGGVFVEYPIGNKMKKEVSISLVERGAKTDMSYVENSSGIRIIKHDTFNVSYLYVSLGMKDRFYIGNHFYYVLGGSAEWGWKGRSSTTMEGTTDIVNIFEGDNDLLQKRWDITILAGCGFDIGKRINIEYNAAFGLVNLARNNVISETHNYGMSLSLGFKF